MAKYNYPSGFWTYDNCKNYALKFTSRYTFQKECSGAYRAALNNNWLDDICSHMKIQGNTYKRLVYVYEFTDNSAYIGLTYNMDIRNKQHLTKSDSSVFKHISECKSDYILKELTEFLPVDEAVKMESMFLNEYRDNNWKILNRFKTGAIGGNVLKWDKVSCEAESKKYSLRSHFKEYSNGAYKASLKNKWLDDFFPKK